MNEKGEMIEIWVEPGRLTGNRQYYRVSCCDVVLENEREPILAICRRLLANGVTGLYQTRCRGIPYPCMTGDIETSAKLRVEESRKHGPRFRRFTAWEGPQ